MSIVQRRKPKVRRYVVRRAESNPPLDADPSEKIWVKRGVEDVAFQREAGVT